MKRLPIPHSLGAILVNQEGKRFCNDLSTRDAVSAAELEQTGGHAYIIFDQNLVDHNKSAQEYINKDMAATASAATLSATSSSSAASPV